jgi:HD-GYP domain-containing protein (c-di-GMP phosphodiesterase class II)
VRSHPQLSQRLLARAGLATPAVEIAVLQHYERWDGGCCPAGLVGDAIPIEARCVSIADAYAAITVDRLGRSGMSPADGLAALTASAGQFDEALFARFAQLLDHRVAPAA